MLRARTQGSPRLGSFPAFMWSSPLACLCFPLYVSLEKEVLTHRWVISCGKAAVPSSTHHSVGGQEEMGTPKGRATWQRYTLDLHHSALPLRMPRRLLSSGLFHCSHGKCSAPKHQHCLLQNPCHPPLCKCLENHSLQLFTGIRDPFMSLGIWLSQENPSLKYRPRSIVWKAVAVTLDKVVSTPCTHQRNMYQPGSVWRDHWRQAQPVATSPLDCLCMSWMWVTQALAVITAASQQAQQGAGASAAHQWQLQHKVSSLTCEAHRQQPSALSTETPLLLTRPSCQNCYDQMMLPHCLFTEQQAWGSMVSHSEMHHVQAHRNHRIIE